MLVIRLTKMIKAKTSPSFCHKLLISLFLLFFSFSAVNAQSKEKVLEKFPNGKVKMKGTMLQNNKVGIWYYYNPAGWIFYKEKWRNGILRWRIEYNEKHQKVRGINGKGEEIIYKGCNCKN